VGKLRPFRFGVQEHRADSASEWKEKARRIESMGYSALYLPDHFNEQMAPIAGLMAAADATTSLRIGFLVLDNDYRHPVVVAKEAATLDVLSDGRFDLGLGAGWQKSDYDQSGLQFDSPGTRIERLDEAIKIIKGIFTATPFSFAGKHYTVKDVQGYPLPVQKPHPPFVLGGGGRRMLSLAAREADIVHVNYNLREGERNAEVVRTGRASATDEKMGWIKQAAGDRFDEIEIAATIFFTSVTDDRLGVASAIAERLQLDPEEIPSMPHFLIGTIDQLAEDLIARRERYGISNFVFQGEVAEHLAPLVERLAGK
jgi:probable F420-dependent oxidoreductase